MGSLGTLAGSRPSWKVNRSDSIPPASSKTAIMDYETAMTRDSILPIRSKTHPIAPPSTLTRVQISPISRVTTSDTIIAARQSEKPRELEL